METRKTQLHPEIYYHIYNRGINGQDLYFEEKNYTYFLQKYTQYVHPFFDTYAYCLMKNHFHLLVRAKHENVIREYLKGKHKTMSSSWILSNSFSSLFKSYAQAINKIYQRSGGLFEEPFHRIPVHSTAYFSQLVGYIHQNPEKHGFVRDFRDYPYSSYYSHLNKGVTKLKRDEVLSWFGSREQYSQFHYHTYQLNHIKELVIEF